MQQNLNKYPIECPTCKGVDFIRTLGLEFGQSLIEKTRHLVCVGCQGVLPLDKAIKAVQMRMKREDLEQMERELEQFEGV